MSRSSSARLATSILHSQARLLLQLLSQLLTQRITAPRLGSCHTGSQPLNLLAHKFFREWKLLETGVR